MAMECKKIVDVSQWNGDIDWTKVKTDGAIIKIITKSGNPDPKFEQNFKGAAAGNMPIGVYNYSYATTVDRAVSDANAVLRVLGGRKLKMGVWLDIEDACLPKSHLLVEIINAYAHMIISSGYDFGVYTGLSYYNSYLKKYKDELPYQFWIARYPTKAKMTLDAMPKEDKTPDIANKLYGWQYTSSGQVDGIKGNVDLSIVYDKDMVPEQPVKTPVNTTVINEAPKALGSGVVTASALHIRSGAGTEFPSLGLLPKGTTVKILKKDYTTKGVLWYNVSVNKNGMTGYCHSKYIKTEV